MQNVRTISDRRKKADKHIFSVYNDRNEEFRIALYVPINSALPTNDKVLELARSKGIK